MPAFYMSKATEMLLSSRSARKLPRSIADLARIDGDKVAGVEGVIANTNVINSGVIRIEAASKAAAWLDSEDGHQLTNTGTIRVRGDLSAGMQTVESPSLGSAGLDLEMLNSGRITTDGDLGIGMALGISFGGKVEGFGAAEGGSIINRGVIETEGDGAAGIAMNGNGHHLVNSGRITADGGAFDGDPVGLFRAAGVVVTGDDALVENTRSGAIISRNADWRPSS